MLPDHNYTKWSNRLAFDIALRLENSGEDIKEIMLRHNVTAQHIAAYSKDPLFQNKVTAYRDEIRDKGVTFRIKAKAQAEELLKTSWVLIHSPDVSAAVKADLIKSTVKWAGLEPKTDAPEGVGGGGVRILINLGGGTVSAPLIEASAETADAA